jgi:hypothetical protein
MMLQLPANRLEQRNWMTLLTFASFALCAASAIAAADTGRPAYIAAFLGFAMVGAVAVRWRADRDEADQLRAAQFRPRAHSTTSEKTSTSSWTTSGTATSTWR